MDKKKVVIATGNAKVANTLLSDIKQVFGDNLTYQVLLSKQPEFAESSAPIDADLYLITGWQNMGNLASRISDISKVLRVTRTISKTGLQRLMMIPPVSRVLVVNDSMRSIMTTQDLLRDIYPELTYVAYAPELYDPTVTIAVTPGEPGYVPTYIEQTVDIGDRHIDTATFVSIFNILNINSTDIYMSLLQYFSTIVERGYLSKQYREDLIHTARWESILHKMEQGLLLTMPNGEILVANEQAERIAGCSIRIGTHTLRDIFPESVVEQLSHMNCDTRTLSISGREIIVKHDTIGLIANVVQHLYFFSDITYLHSLEESVSTRTKEKGFVAKYTFDDIIHRSKAMSDCIERLKIFAKSDMTVLIQGESGVGKELVAQSIHNSSMRRNQPFVAINCAALPESLLESELFGYEKGAFTGAKQSGKMGLFELANNGTIFLDEIGDMPLLLQSRLLRVLQEKQVMRIGGDYMIGVNIRVIAASNQNLEEKIKAGTFRHDLYYRLNVMPCKVAPLRERRDDILPLFLHFAERSGIPDEIASLLMQYDWPGNVRELQNAANYYAMMHDFDNPLPEYIVQSASPRPAAGSDLSRVILKLLSDGALGRTALLEKLRENGHDVSEYALRKELERLETEGLLVKSVGRGGTSISELGLRALESAMPNPAEHTFP